MGSSESRLSGAPVAGADGSGAQRKHKQSFLRPILSSLSCGTSSSWRKDSFTQECPFTLGDTPPQKSFGTPIIHEAKTNLRQQRLGETFNRDISDGQSTTDISGASVRSICGSLDSADPSLLNGCSSSSDDTDSFNVGQSVISFVGNDRQGAKKSRSQSSFDTESLNDECLPTSYDSCYEHVSNQSTPGEQIHTVYGVGDVSRVHDTSDCMFKPESSAVNSDLGRLDDCIHNGCTIAAGPSSSQNTVSLQRSDSFGVVQYNGSGLAESIDDFVLLRQSSSGREARRNNSRRLWDSFIRASSRRRRLSPFRMQADEDLDTSGPLNNNWGSLDWDDHELSNNLDNENGAMSGASSTIQERQWRAGPQVCAIQHFGASMGERFGHTRHCALSRHSSGNCSCGSFAMTEESSTRASISQIVMLAEALFEVLDEIHRQSVTLSRSTSLPLVSLPAPEEVVNSFASRMYKKSDPFVSSLGLWAECHICLIEYEDGDYIRVLPCSHEFHMLCVDKWLKEAHRVCPLCRCNVCEEPVRS